MDQEIGFLDDPSGAHIQWALWGHGRPLVLRRAYSENTLFSIKELWTLATLPNATKLIVCLNFHCYKFLNAKNCQLNQILFVESEHIFFPGSLCQTVGFTKGARSLVPSFYATMSNPTFSKRTLFFLSACPCPNNGKVLGLPLFLNRPYHS